MQQKKLIEDIELTFQPNSNSRPKPTKYFPDENDYKKMKEKQKMKEATKETILNQKRLDEEIEELKECTFFPNINRNNPQRLRNV